MIDCLFNCFSYFHLIYALTGTSILLINENTFSCDGIRPFIIASIVMATLGFITTHKKVIAKGLNPMWIWCILQLFYLGIFLNNYVNLKTECKDHIHENNHILWSFYIFTAYICIIEFIIIVICIFIGCVIQMFQCLIGHGDETDARVHENTELLY